MKAVASKGRVAAKANCHKSRSGGLVSGKSKWTALKHKDKRAVQILKVSRGLPQFRGLLPDENLAASCPYRYVRSFRAALERASQGLFGAHFVGCDKDFLRMVSQDAAFAIKAIDSGDIESLGEISISI